MSKKSAHESNTSPARLLLLLTVCVSMLTACASGTVQARLPDRPVSLQTPCSPPSTLAGDAASTRAVLLAHAEDAEAIHTCSARQSALSAWIDNLYNQWNKPAPNFFADLFE